MKDSAQRPSTVRIVIPGLIEEFSMSVASNRRIAILNAQLRPCHVPNDPKRPVAQILSLPCRAEDGLLAGKVCKNAEDQFCAPDPYSLKKHLIFCIFNALQVAIITGSGQGLGAAAAKLFAQHGAKIVVSDIDATKAQQVLIHALIRLASELTFFPYTPPGASSVLLLTSF